jgi:hypothetical protein
MGCEEEEVVWGRGWVVKRKRLSGGRGWVVKRRLSGIRARGCWGNRKLSWGIGDSSLKDM